MMRAPLLGSLLLLGGCISLLPEPPPPPRIFVLEAAEVAPLEVPVVDGAIAVAQPSGERALMGTDLVWRSGDEIAFVAATQWSGRAEFALQSMLVETLVRQGRFRAATRAGEGRADFEVRWEVLDFQIAEEAMQARFTVDVRVLRSPGRRIVAQRIISVESPVADRSQSAAAQALARAAREGSARIGAFAAEAAGAAG